MFFIIEFGVAMLKYFPLLLITLLLFSCAPEEEPVIITGPDRFAEEDFTSIAGYRVGLVTNHTATVGDEHIADIMHQSDVIELKALFGPEHGIRGDAPAGAQIEDDVDEQTGVPVYSLYGDTRKPTPEMLEDVEILIFDIQDIGARFYTYISTMGYAMQAAAEEGIPFIVLDRPNPLGGELVEGFTLEEEFASFVGMYPIPVVHGMTVAELAEMIVAADMLEGLDRLDLHIIEVLGWDRTMLWTDLERDWIPPSPNIPDFETALIYPGACFFEGTIASEGRGTQQPFKQVGAPWIDAEQLADDMNERNLPGLEFEPVSFTPESIEGMAVNPKFEGEEVHGVRYVITDMQSVRPVEAGVHLLHAFLQQAPDREDFFIEDRFIRLAGTAQLHNMLLDGYSPEDIIANWSDDVENFKSLREPYLHYNEDMPL